MTRVLALVLSFLRVFYPFALPFLASMLTMCYNEKKSLITVVDTVRLNNSGIGVNGMSFNDRLRQLNIGPDYRDREKLLIDTAEKCADHFAHKCEVFAIVGYTTWKEPLKYEIGEFVYIVYVSPDSRYEEDKKEEDSSYDLTRKIYIKASEADKFLNLLKSEFEKREMENVIITKRDWPYLKTVYQEKRFVTLQTYGRYSFQVEMSW